MIFLGTAVGLWQFTIVETQADLVTEAIAGEQVAALENMQQAQQQAYTTILVTGVLTLLAAGVLGVAVTRSIAEPLSQLDFAAKALARRQFDQRGVFHVQLEVSGLPVAVTGRNVSCLIIGD